MVKPIYRKCWTQETVDRYFTSEAMSKTREAFNEVHVPIDRILVDPEYPAARGRQEISEGELLSIITASRPEQPNRIFLVVGDTGSGKSELCQWLNYNVQDDVHVPILIERRMIRLREIVEEIHRHLGDEPVPTDLVEITDLWPETVSAKLRAAVLMRLQQSQVQNALGTIDVDKLRQILNTPAFEGRMRMHFEHYRAEIKRLDQPRQLQLLPEPDFKDLAVQAGGLRDPTQCYHHIQRAMVDCLASELQVEDLVQKLGRISQGYRRAGKRPVLLIEDITTFGFLQNDLLDYLYNLTGGNYDVVLGITIGFEGANKTQIYKTQQTITERIQGRFNLTDRHYETVFLHDHYLDLAQRYLAAVRSDTCEVCPQNSACAQAFGNDLYPFNQPFLTNIYRSLHQGESRKQTPRLYLRAIQGVLESDQLPPQAIELSPNVKEPGIYFAQDADLTPAAERLIKWYGINTNVGVFVSQAIAQVFGVSLPAHIEQLDGFYLLRLRPGAERRLDPPPDFLPSIPGNVGPEPPPIGPEPAPPIEPTKPSPPEQPNYLAQLDDWLAQKGQFPDRQVFKDGVYALLQLYQLEPFALKHSDSIADSRAPLVFERGDKYAKLYLHHSADDKPYHKLTIRPEKAKQDLFSQVLAIGIGDYAVADAEQVDHAQLYDWLAASVRDLQTEMRQALDQALRMPLETFVAFTKFLLLNVTSDVHKLQAETLARPITEEPLALPGMGDRARHLWENRDHIQALFVALFHYRDNLVDYPLLRQTVSTMNASDLLQEVERIGDVPAGFYTRVARVDLPFQSLVKLVKDYVGYLQGRIRSRNYALQPSKTDLSAVLEFCYPRGSVDPDRLRLQVDELRQAVHTAKIKWQGQWDLRLESLHRAPGSLDFDRLHDSITALLVAIAQVPQPLSIFAYLVLQRQVDLIVHRPEFEVLQTIDSMQSPLSRACLDRTLGKPQMSKQMQEFEKARQELQEVFVDERA